MSAASASSGDLQTPLRKSEVPADGGVVTSCVGQTRASLEGAGLDSPDLHLGVVDWKSGVDQHPHAGLDGKHTSTHTLHHLVEDGRSVGRGVQAPNQPGGQRLPCGPTFALSGLVETLHHAQQHGVLVVANQAHGSDERAECEL